MDEQISETKALHKAIHRPLRKWFRNLDGELAKQYGDFPLFHHDLAAWEHFKVVYKMYQADIEPPQTITSTNKEQPPASTEREGITANVSANVSTTAANTKGDAPSGSASDASSQPPPTKRRRKSRFSSNSESSSSSTTTTSTSTTTTAGTTRVRKSRFSGSTLTPKQQQLTLLNARLQDLQKEFVNLPVVAAEKEKEEGDSVKPTYDSNGKRTNRLIDRMRNALVVRRTNIFREMVKCDPSVKDKLKAQGVNLESLKFVKKMYIPVKDFPNYNFFGLIIGPRGSSQKKLEAQSGAKISIRGKGSVKEGMRGRRDAKKRDSENEPLHVVIRGETEESVAKAVALVTPLLNPIDDDDNDYKQAQLRELALINGTLRTEVYCKICGEQGHRQFECPKRHGNQMSFRAQVRCAICGDTSHVTADCKLTVEEVAAGARERESDFQGFLADLGDESAQQRVAQMGDASSLSSSSSSRPINRGPIEILGGAVSSGSSGSSGSGSSSSSGGGSSGSGNMSRRGPIEVLGGGSSSSGGSGGRRPVEILGGRPPQQMKQQQHALPPSLYPPPNVSASPPQRHINSGSIEILGGGPSAGSPIHDSILPGPLSNNSQSNTNDLDLDGSPIDDGDTTQHSSSSATALGRYGNDRSTLGSSDAFLSGPPPIPPPPPLMSLLPQPILLSGPPPALIPRMASNQQYRQQRQDQYQWNNVKATEATEDVDWD
jgi:splicing factor 1